MRVDTRSYLTAVGIPSLSGAHERDASNANIGRELSAIEVSSIESSSGGPLLPTPGAMPSSSRASGSRQSEGCFLTSVVVNGAEASHEAWRVVPRFPVETLRLKMSAQLNRSKVWAHDGF